MNFQIVILSAKKQSGKTTLGDHLVEKYGYIRVALADSLKDLSADLINLFYGTDIKDKDTNRVRRYMNDQEGKEKNGFNLFRSKFHVYVNNINAKEDIEKKEIKIPDRVLTIRKILQSVGKLTRDHIDSKVWIKKLDRKIKRYLTDDPNMKIVIDDVRMSDEHDYFVKKYGARSIRINRKQNKIEMEDITEQLDFECEFNIDNNASIDEAKEKLDNIIMGKKDKKKTILL